MWNVGSLFFFSSGGDAEVLLTGCLQSGLPVVELKKTVFLVSFERVERYDYTQAKEKGLALTFNLDPTFIWSEFVDYFMSRVFG